jgi:hypothetical protein
MTTITIDRAVLEQAVEVLSHRGNIYHYQCPVAETIEALREALNAPSNYALTAERDALRDALQQAQTVDAQSATQMHMPANQQVISSHRSRIRGAQP